jgi:hypothetical protein
MTITIGFNTWCCVINTWPLEIVRVNLSLITNRNHTFVAASCCGPTMIEGCEEMIDHYTELKKEARERNISRVN